MPMSKSFTFELITPEGLKYEAEIFQVLLPTQSGVIGVLSGHEHLLTIITTGVLSIYPHADTAEEAIEYVAVSSGFAEIFGKRVRILADSAERADEIDELKAMEALEKAKKMQLEAKDQVAMSDALSVIERQAVRLKVAGLKRRRRA